MKMADISTMNLDDAAVISLRQCGHFLHHSVGKGQENTNSELMSVLTEEEKKVMVDLLQKCLKHWEERQENAQ